MAFTNVLIEMIDVGAISMMVIIFAITGALITLSRKGKKEQSKAGKPYPPTLPALPIVGSLPFLGGGGMGELPHKFFQLSYKLGPVISFYSGAKRAFVLNGKKAIVDALYKRAEVFGDRTAIWTEAKLFNTELRGIIWAHYDERFKRYQKLTLSIMREFGFGVTQESDIRIWNEAEKMIKDIRSYNGRPFNPSDILNYSITNVIVNILFGEEFQSNDEEVRKIIHSAYEFLGNVDPAFDIAPLIRFLPMYRKKVADMRHAKHILHESIEKAIQYNKSSKSTESTFTKRFVEIEGPNYNHQDLVHILRDLCLGSADTVVLVIQWALLEMANHPDVKARVQREIDEVVPENRLPSYDDRSHMPYSEATVLELARFHTLVPFPTPRATLRDTEASGYFIPKGSMILENVYSAHMDPATWSDPENFRPERFLDKDGHVFGRENIIQFGVGKRACIGEALARQEVFVYFCSLMQHFDMQPPEGQTSVNATRRSGLVQGPTPFEIRLIPRKNKIR